MYRHCSVDNWGAAILRDLGNWDIRCVALGELLKLSLGTVTASLGVELLALAIALVDALVLSADHVGLSARAADRCAVTEIGVDSDQVRFHSKGLDVLDDDFSWRLLAVVGAVAARSVEFTGIDDSVVTNGYSSRAASIELVGF